MSQSLFKKERDAWFPLSSLRRWSCMHLFIYCVGRFVKVVRGRNRCGPVCSLVNSPNPAEMMYSCSFPRKLRLAHDNWLMDLLLLSFFVLFWSLPTLMSLWFLVFRFRRMKVVWNDMTQMNLELSLSNFSELTGCFLWFWCHNNVLFVMTQLLSCVGLRWAEVLQWVCVHVVCE